MAADATNDAWMETCIIAIAVQGGNDIKFAGVTETMDFEFGEKDIEGIPLVNGGRMTKFVPEGDSQVTFEAYPLEAGTSATAADSSGTGFFDMLHQKDSTAPIRVLNSRLRSKYRCLFLWTNDAAAVTAYQTTAANKSALRIGMADGYFTSVKASFTDGVLKFTCVYKCAAYDKAGNSCVMVESCAGGAADVLPVIAAYTTSNKFG